MLGYLWQVTPVFQGFAERAAGSGGVNGNGRIPRGGINRPVVADRRGRQILSPPAFPGNGRPGIYGNHGAIGGGWPQPAALVLASLRSRRYAALGRDRAPLCLRAPQAH